MDESIQVGAGPQAGKPAAHTPGPSPQGPTDGALSVSVVVPTYHEVENLRELTDRIGTALAPLKLPYEVVVVDDNSRDGTVELMAKLADEGRPVRLITRVNERGLSTAVIRGFDEAKGEVLVCMDADLSHPPEAIPKLVEQVRGSGAEFVLGSRYVAGASTDESWGAFRWLNSKVATFLARPFARVNDPMSGFFALPRSVYARAAKLSPVGYKIALELLVKCGCEKVEEVPIHFANRKHGQSKLNLKEQVNYIKHLKRLADFKYGGFSQFAQFCVVGATGMVVDLGLLTLLLRTGLVYEASRALAIWMAMTWNFWLNRRLTFSYSRRGSALSQYPRFVASCGVGALINWGTSVGLVKAGILADRGILAAVIGILLGTISNFLFSRHWVFRAGTRP